MSILKEFRRKLSAALFVCFCSSAFADLSASLFHWLLLLRGFFVRLAFVYGFAVLRLGVVCSSAAVTIRRRLQLGSSAARDYPSDLFDPQPNQSH